ncbi:MAG: hypothetical protein ACI4SF_02130 [Oscillospiraceae bacterium]
MKKYIPLEKMSKKMQREYYKKQRKGWGEISPITRCPDNPKAYNRAKSKRDWDYGSHADFF